MQGFTPRLFVIRNDFESRRAKTLLTRNRIPFDVVDLANSDALAFIERDLGAKQLPFLVAGQAKYEGLAQIRKFAVNRR